MKKLFLYLVILLSSAAFADVINVPEDKASIQAAIDSAATGDTVLVSEGTYYGNITFKGKAIIVASMFLMDGNTSHISKTIIDGNHPANSSKASVVTFNSGEDTTSVLNGFTITGGSGTQYTTQYAGVYSLRGGGGILIRSGARIINNNIVNNKVVSTSTSSRGAGISIDIDAGKQCIIKNNLVANNKASGQFGVGGGGISVFGNGSVLISKNVITNNSVESVNPIDFISGGGGLLIVADSPELFNNIISGNEAPFGGGITAWTGIANLNFKLINNTVADNNALIKGGGLYLYNGHCTAINNIFWNNTAPEDSDIFYRGEMNLSYSITQKIFSGIGNRQSDPLFEDSPYNLSDASPAIDAGNPDQKFNDPADPNNPSIPLGSAKGSLTADMGAFGGNDTVHVEREDYLVKENFLKKQFGSMPYRFAYPTDYDSSSIYPLTIVLHGAGDTGTDNESQMLCGFYWRTNAQHYGYNDFTVVPQAPLYQGWGDKSLITVHDLITQIIKTLPVDTTRIVVTGHSMGGGGTKQLLTMYPRLFAAGIPISGIQEGNPDVYKHIPLWLHHGGSDPQVSVAVSRNVVNALETTGLTAIKTKDADNTEILEAIENGTRLFYTELNGAGHNITNYAYDNANMFFWLKKQRLPLIYPQNSNADRNYYSIKMDTIHIATELANPIGFQYYQTLILERFNKEKLDSLVLYDDGMHGDGLSQDGIWGTYINPLSIEANYRIGIEIHNTDKGQNFYFQDLIRFTTKGPVVVDNIIITKTDTNSYKLEYDLRNDGISSTVNNISAVVVSKDANVKQIYATLNFPDLGPGDVKSNRYHSAHTIYTKNNPDSIELVVNIYSGNDLFWRDILVVVLPNSVVGINEAISVIPYEYKLAQNYPNPFNPNTTITYSIRKAELVTLKVYDILGREIATLVEGKKAAGTYHITFDTMNLSSGIYFYRIKAGSYIETKKMILLK